MVDLIRFLVWSPSSNSYPALMWPPLLYCLWARGTHPDIDRPARDNGGEGDRGSVEATLSAGHGTEMRRVASHSWH
ncbi:hypothetical protein RRG08_055311 [Elysia crispata]|uniref:Uncharacterized protein n=1 Tax=Elysia crispata TaxID=231223 RepID=A0AAE1E2I7_9GAST|nr:hypothetical protein RRG08_055311 [Elysia crispata]